EAVGEDDVEEPVASGPVFVAAGGIGLAFGVRVVVDHLAFVGFDVVEDVEQGFGGDDREVVGLFGGVGGRVVPDYQTMLAAERAAGLVGIAFHNVRGHRFIDFFRDTHHKRIVRYHSS